MEAIEEDINLSPLHIHVHTHKPAHISPHVNTLHTHILMQKMFKVYIFVVLNAMIESIKIIRKGLQR